MSRPQRWQWAEGTLKDCQQSNAAPDETNETKYIVKNPKNKDSIDIVFKWKSDRTFFTGIKYVFLPLIQWKTS